MYKKLVLSEDLIDEILFLAEENIPSTVISETLGISVHQVDEFRRNHTQEFGLGKIHSTRI